MAHRLASERVPVRVDDLTVEVEVVHSWPLYVHGVRLGATFDPEKPAAAQMAALDAIYSNFVAEAQPTWEIVDHRGPVPATVAGMLRLPLSIAFGMTNGWLETAEVQASAVDMLIPEGKLRDDLNAALKGKRSA